jgi:hypothetical protein
MCWHASASTHPTQRARCGAPTPLHRDSFLNTTSADNMRDAIMTCAMLILNPSSAFITPLH